MPFNDSPIFWVSLGAIVVILIIIAIIVSKRKSRKISGYFLHAEANIEKRKTVSLIELNGEQRRKIKEFSDNQQATDEQWGEFLKNLGLSVNNAFDWRPTVKYAFSKNGVYLIRANGQGTHIKLEVEMPCGPVLQTKKSF